MVYQRSLKNSTLVQPCYGTKRFTNILWGILTTSGGLGFFLTGLSSFFGVSFLFSESVEISFLPQGITTMFYGTIGIIIGLFLSLTAFWNIGSGYNKYCNSTKEIKLWRKKFPGISKKNNLTIKIPFSHLKSIKIKIKKGNKRGASLVASLSDKRQIPLTYEDETEKCQKTATLLSDFGSIPLESSI